ncbi:MAG TPA: phosphoglycolate phosphatase [Casimicrobiaceae bacterium]|nr:phosphoglycolate phosphatase [Casimicrobiaceae bacterium]
MSEAAPRALAVRAVLFDLDGTLADSAGDLALALNRIRADRGLPAVAVEDLRPFASAGARGLLHRGMGIAPGDPEYDALREQFLANYESCLAQTTKLFDGTEELLATVEARGLPWGIVTNKHMRFTARVVAALGLADRTAVVVAGDTTPHPKPHPAPLLHAANELRLAPGDCMYVGDDLRDVEAGRAAGMATIVASYGYLGVGGDPARWPATGWIERPLALVDWLPAA